MPGTSSVVHSTKKGSSVRISLRGETLVLEFQPTPDLLAKVRALPVRSFNPLSCAWEAPHTKENWAALQAAGFDLGTLPAPTTTGYLVDAKDQLLKVVTPF